MTAYNAHLKYFEKRTLLSRSSSVTSVLRTCREEGSKLCTLNVLFNQNEALFQNFPIFKIFLIFLFCCKDLFGLSKRLSILNACEYKFFEQSHWRSGEDSRILPCSPSETSIHGKKSAENVSLCWLPDVLLYKKHDAELGLKFDIKLLNILLQRIRITKTAQTFTVVYLIFTEI